jgi:DNA-binding CsgD family transcriptional regulator
MPEVQDVEQALVHLSDVASKLLVSYRSMQDAVVRGGRDRIGPSQLPYATAELLAAAAHSVLAITGLPDQFGLLPPSTILAEVAAGGAEVRVLGQDGVRADPVGGQSLRALARCGVQVATVPVIPPAIVIADRRSALMALSEPPDGAAGGAFLLHDLEVAGYLASTIDSFWAIALSLHDSDVAGNGGLSQADQALLRLLAQGKTQQEAARSLNLSVRTVSRRIADLKQQLKADSPLQAGMEAVRRGWL